MRVVLLVFLIEFLLVTLWLMGRWYFLIVRSKSHAALLRHPIVSAANLPVQTASSPLEATHWAFINEWHQEGQHDDRLPVIGLVAASGGTASARRAFARRSHQLNYKEWSRDRHD